MAALLAGCPCRPTIVGGYPPDLRSLPEWSPTELQPGVACPI